MSPVQAFLSDPPAFLRRHYVVFKGFGPEVEGGVEHPFVMAESHKHSARRSVSVLGLSAKIDGKVFELRACTPLQGAVRTTDEGERFNAIWSGYKAGQAIHCPLGGQGAELMLTPALTGCTIAYAAQSDGNAWFSHYNLKDPSAPTQTLPLNGMLMNVQADYGGDDAVGMMSKEHYREKVKHRGGAGLATVVGWRRQGQWTFWAQYIEVKGEVFQIRGVEQLSPGVRFG